MAWRPRDQSWQQRKQQERQRPQPRARGRRTSPHGRAENDGRQEQHRALDSDIDQEDCKRARTHDRSTSLLAGVLDLAPDAAQILRAELGPGLVNERNHRIAWRAVEERLQEATER